MLSAAKPSAENSHYGSSGVGFENPNDQKPLYKRLKDKFHYTRTGARAPAGAQTTEKMKKNIYVLVACEESQRETTAFRELGAIAFSCDIQPSMRGTNKGWHIVDDVIRYLQGCTQFTTEDGKKHKVPRWDLIVSHPPCTYICKMGAVQMVKNGKIDKQRFDKMLDAVAFWWKCYNAKAKYIAVENPIPMARAQLPKPSFYTCPSHYGYKYTKKTLWWVKNLSPVMAEIDYPQPKSFVASSRGKYRSRTFERVAKACAKTWINDIINDRKNERNKHQQNQ